MSTKHAPNPPVPGGHAGVRAHAGAARTLPEPDADAAAHSATLARGIAAAIDEAGGTIPFARFMELALYAPGLGYYSAGAIKFGAGGDFVTAPEMGPVFAACVATALAPVLQAIGPAARVLELGGGSGAFAQAALKRLMELDALPDRYAILEPSAELRERQRTRLRERLPPLLFALLEWPDGPFEDDWDGVVFANEVIDALPTSRFAIVDGEVHEEHVVVERVDAGVPRFARVLRPGDAFLSQAVRHVERTLDAPLPAGRRGEVLPQLPYWIQAVSGGMRRGAMLFVDYGAPRRELHSEANADGTLRAFARHRVHADVLRWPGLQDITASVDFTALAEAGVNAGFDLAGYCSQASFLLGNGLPEVLARIEAIDDEAERLRRTNEVRQLTLPEAMGERFGVMGFSKDVLLEAAFLVGDLTWRL